MSFEQFVKHILEEVLKRFSGPAEDPVAPEEAPAAPPAPSAPEEPAGWAITDETIGTVIQFFFDRMKAALKQ